MHSQMKRLYEAADALKGLKTQAEIARVLNQSSQTVNNWEARGISKSGMLKAQSAIGCSANWLETGTGEMTLTPTDIRLERRDQSSPSDISPFLDQSQSVRLGEEPDTIPIRRVTLKLRAGATGFETEPDTEDGGVIHMPRNIIESSNLTPHKLLAIRVRGQSMEPMMFEDDVIVIDTNDRTPISRELYAVNFDGEGLVKQLVRRDGEWYLYSLNSDFGPVNVRSGQCAVVGRVVYQPGRVVTGRL